MSSEYSAGELPEPSFQISHLVLATHLPTLCEHLAEVSGDHAPSYDRIDTAKMAKEAGKGAKFSFAGCGRSDIVLCCSRSGKTGYNTAALFVYGTRVKASQAGQAPEVPCQSQQTAPSETALVRDFADTCSNNACEGSPSKDPERSSASERGWRRFFADDIGVASEGQADKGDCTVLGVDPFGMPSERTRTLAQMDVPHRVNATIGKVISEALSTGRPSVSSAGFGRTQEQAQVLEALLLLLPHVSIGEDAVSLWDGGDTKLPCLLQPEGKGPFEV